MTRRLLLPSLAVALLASCSAQQSGTEQKSQKQADPAQRVVAAVDSALNGLYAPGTAQQAKEQGFNTCTPAKRDIVCHLSSPQPIYGITPRNVTVRLNGRDNLSWDESTTTGYEDAAVGSIPIEHLSYGEIIMTFRQEHWEPGCRAKNGGWLAPAKCVKNSDTLTHMREALEQNGWMLGHQDRWGMEYAHPTKPIMMLVEYEAQDVRLRTITARDHAYIKIANHQRQRNEAGAKAITEQMR